MSLEDQLRKLPQSIREVPKPEKEFETRKQFVNDKIFPPLLKIQQACEKSESAFYLKLPYAKLPVSLRNFPDGIMLVWGKLILPESIQWKYCISVSLYFQKSYIAVKVGSRDFEVILMDDDFIERYDIALGRSLEAIQKPEYLPCKVGLVDWQRFYQTKL